MRGGDLTRWVGTVSGNTIVLRDPAFDEGGDDDDECADVDEVDCSCSFCASGRPDKRVVAGADVVGSYMFDSPSPPVAASTPAPTPDPFTDEMKARATGLSLAEIRALREENR